MLGIVMPVWLTDVEALWESTVRALLSTGHKSDSDFTPSYIYVVPNRLHRMDETGLDGYLRARLQRPVNVLPWDGARSVAGAWNQGIQAAMKDGCDQYLIMANDCYWEPGAIENMVQYGKSPASRNVLAWSGYGFRGGVELKEPVEGCDCTGFMIRPETIETVGWFDDRYRPAYFEDNDYCTRIILSGHTCKVVPSARFLHPGSTTVKNDPEAAHHVGHWFERNKARFAAKWGTPTVPTSDADCLARCFKHPWNDPTLPLAFCDRD